ncbi:MAG: type II toxin-antitoxin system VapB family antitoxin [Methyloprofundus sp.]|nr:type II toxin-antitoxin system VapB family antitoxin [Methyloprofundus sp.]
MRTNIVLDDTLVTQALALTGASSKKEVVNLALSQLVVSYREKNIDKQQFIAAYMDNPIISDEFTPLERDEIYAR